MRNKIIDGPSAILFVFFVAGLFVLYQFMRASNAAVGGLVFTAITLLGFGIKESLGSKTPLKNVVIGFSLGIFGTAILIGLALLAIFLIIASSFL